MDAIRLKPSDRKLAAKVYARGFFGYPTITSYWPDPERRARYLEWFLGCIINYGIRYGEVYTTPDIAGIAVWLPPGQPYISTWRCLQTGLLLLPFAVGTQHFFTHTLKSDDLVLKTHVELVPRPHWYLWGIAVDPDQQGRGIGTLLMQPVLERADAQHLPCYLETHDEKNVPFYLKRGFNLLRTVQAPGFDVRFWCFLREAEN